MEDEWGERVGGGAGEKDREREVKRASVESKREEREEWRMSGERGWEGVQVRKTERERVREPALRVKEKKERNGG